jgi:inner membrane transporter RhtA
MRLNARQRGAAPILALIVAMLSIQYGASIAKTLFPVAGAAGTTALRLGFAAAMLIVVMRPWRQLPPRAAWGALAGYGASLGVMNLCFYLALARIPLGIAVALEFLGPLTVALLGSRRRLDFAFVGLALTGILLLCPPFPRAGAGLDTLGVLLALGAGVCWALYIVFGQRAGAALGSARASTLGTILAAMLVLPVGIVVSGPVLLSMPVLLKGAVIGFFSSALPYSLEMVALTRMPARTYGTLTSLEPAVGAIVGLAVLGETLSGTQWAGIAAIGAASIGAALSMDRPIAMPE